MDPITYAALRRPFAAEQIGKLPKPYRKDAEKGNCGECGGFHGLPAMHLDYVGHAAVTDRLNEVDPSWTWEPLGLDPQGLPALDRDGNLWIKMTVAGVTRLGCGDGPEAKQRIGDAIRNAAMRYGVAVDLWSKEDLLTEQIETDPTWLAASIDLIDGALTHDDLKTVGQRISAAVADGKCSNDDRRDLAARWRAKSAEIGAQS